METAKICLYCAKKISGRVDKKFCNNNCRSTYHNDLFSNKINYVRQINYLLQKNRKILAQAFAAKACEKKVPVHELYLQGFSSMHYTHQHQINKNNCYNFCYDYGYKMVGKSHVLIVKTDN